MLNVKWLFDQYMLDRCVETGFPRIDRAAQQAGYETYVTTFTPGQPNPIVPWNEGCVVTWGSHRFVNHFKNRFGKTWIPGFYHRLPQLGYLGYSPHIGSLLLNDDFIILPYGEVKRRHATLFGGNFFIKPESVTKTFTGMTITTKNAHDEFAALEQISATTDDLLCVVASIKNINAEFRYIVANNKIITGSEYRWDNILDVRSDTHPLADKLAQQVAEMSWQADTVYTLDIALIQEWTKARVVELNSFSCSGLYSSDTIEIIRHVSQAAWNEYCGLDIIV